MQNIIKIIKKYSVDIILSSIVTSGVFLFFIEKFREPIYRGVRKPYLVGYDYSIIKIIGLILIVVGIDVAIRCYLNYKNKN